jgi:hypothetical protein
MREVDAPIADVLPILTARTVEKVMLPVRVSERGN